MSNTDFIKLPVDIEKVHNSILTGQFGPNGAYLISQNKDNRIISDDDIVAAIIIANGYLNSAAKMLGISVIQINKRRKVCPEIEEAIVISKTIHTERLEKVYNDGMLNGEIQTTKTVIEKDGSLKTTVSFERVDASTRMYHLQKFLEKSSKEIEESKSGVNIQNAVIVVNDEKKQALLEAIRILQS